MFNNAKIIEIIPEVYLPIYAGWSLNPGLVVNLTGPSFSCVVSPCRTATDHTSVTH